MAVKKQTREMIEDILGRLDMVEWDRFVEGDDPDAHGKYINVYGWIEREEDEYKDFVMVRFFPQTENNLMGFTTSSDEWTEEIHERMFGDKPDEHNECQRVEHAFDVPNAIELHENAAITEF